MLLLTAVCCFCLWFAVTAVFTLAYKLQPSIIFIDEVDSFLGQRRQTEHEALTNMKTEFMALWDGFTTDRKIAHHFNIQYFIQFIISNNLIDKARPCCCSENARVMVLAATNRPWELDEAILRRLPRAFEVGMPDKKQRSSILRVILKDENYEDCIDIEQLAALTEGYSGSDLTELCKEAAYMPIRDLLDEERVDGVAEAKEPRPLKQSDFLSVLSTARTSKTAAYEYQHNRSSVMMDGSHSRAGGAASDDEPVDTSVTDLLKLLAAFGAARSAANGASNNR